MKKALFFVSLFVFVFILLNSGCSRKTSKPVYVKNGKEYGKSSGAFFRHRWWNYYDRGLSYVEGEYYEDAAEDLKAAINNREKDQRMARTYGMHFIDYFPHRELGIIYYRTEDFKSAQEELELSLKQYPTAKTRYYLDRVRKKLIGSKPEAVVPPKLRIDKDTKEIRTKDDPVVLSGIAEDDNFISSIRINAFPIFLEGSQKRVVFEKALDLQQGRHIVGIEAKNIVGRIVKHEVIIHVDRKGPIIVLNALPSSPSTAGQQPVILGSVYDESGVAELRINGRNVSIKKEVDIQFSHKLTTGVDRIAVLARDSLGNQTSSDISLSPSASGEPSVLVASLDTFPRGQLFAGFLNKSKSRPPVINLPDWTEEQTVFLEKIYLDGHVTSASNITSLIINDIPILRKKGKIVFFNYFIKLEKGNNTITVQAKDEKGETVVKKININRQIPKALLLDERMSLTIFPFEKKGAISKAGLSIQDNLTHTLFYRNRFKIVERDRIDLVLNEQNLSHTELIDRTTALKIGKLVAAKSIITGSIVETRTGVEIISRMIDTETSEILATEDAYTEEKGLLAMKSLAEGIAIKYHRDFPLSDGLIIEKKGKNILTDLGHNKAGKQKRLVMFREKPVIHPVTGKQLGFSSEIIGRARITQLDSHLSKARITDGKDTTITQMDKVITE